MKTYQEIMNALKPQEAPQDVPEEIPDERGAYREPPQPGSYRFRTPAAIENCFGDVIDVVQKDAEKKPILGADGKPLTYQRVQLVFDGPNALVIMQSPGGKLDGEPFSTRISNVERPRFVSKNQTVKVADMTYLLRAVAPDARPRTNAEFVQACMQLLASKEFGADIEWSGFCNPQNDAYFAFDDEKGGTLYDTAREEGATENKKGCGERVYQKDWTKDAAAGGFAARKQCRCGAWLRPYPQLVRFKA